MLCVLKKKKTHTKFTDLIYILAYHAIIRSYNRLNVTNKFEISFYLVTPQFLFHNLSPTVCPKIQ
jgi:hypothetical protein